MGAKQLVTEKSFVCKKPDALKQYLQRKLTKFEEKGE
jgi:hypothetical protein